MTKTICAYTFPPLPVTGADFVSASTEQEKVREGVEKWKKETTGQEGITVTEKELVRVCHNLS